MLLALGACQVQKRRVPRRGLQRQTAQLQCSSLYSTTLHWADRAVLSHSPATRTAIVRRGLCCSAPVPPLGPRPALPMCSCLKLSTRTALARRSAQAFARAIAAGGGGHWGGGGRGTAPMRGDIEGQQEGYDFPIYGLLAAGHSDVPNFILL